MARQARKISKTDVYHIMVRGINKEQIFKKDFYKTKIINLLIALRQEINFSIIAYCVMDNHLHLLAKIGADDLQKVMQRLNVKYAQYYNKIEDRYGYVFQGRFASEAVENERYLFGVLRYIHNNPIKAHLSDNIINYRWSSAMDFTQENTTIIDDKFMKYILKSFKDKNEFLGYHKSFDDNLYLDTKEEQTANIEQIIQYEIQRFANDRGISDHSQFTIKLKEELARKLISKNLVTNKDVASLCNLSYDRVLEISRNM